MSSALRKRDGDPFADSDNEEAKWKQPKVNASSPVAYQDWFGSILNIPFITISRFIYHDMSILSRKKRSIGKAHLHRPVMDNCRSCIKVTSRRFKPIVRSHCIDYVRNLSNTLAPWCLCDNPRKHCSLIKNISHTDTSMSVQPSTVCPWGTNMFKLH